MSSTRIEKLRALCEEHDIKVRADAGVTGLEKKLADAGIELPKEEQVDMKALKKSYQSNLKQLKALFKAFQAADEKGAPRAKRKFQQKFEVMLASYKDLATGDHGDTELLKKLLQWARQFKAPCSISDLRILNEIEHGEAQGLAECVAEINPARKIQVGQEIKFSIEEGRVFRRPGQDDEVIADVYILYPVVVKAIDEQMPNSIAKRVQNGEHVPYSEYGVEEYKQYHRVELREGEFDKYFRILEDAR